jgi:hypothetical protein
MADPSSRLWSPLKITSLWQIEHVTARERTRYRPRVAEVMGRIGAMVRIIVSPRRRLLFQRPGQATLLLEPIATPA